MQAGGSVSAQNGFSGFADHIAGQWTQQSTAGYVDLEADVSEALALGAMGRIEEHDDFDTTTDVKLAARLRITDNIALRGSASTGFRAPTAGQRNTLNVTTGYDSALADLVQLGTLPPTCEEARILGARPLQPEEAVTFTAGAVADTGSWSLTADFYNIDVDGRISLSGRKDLSAEQKRQIAASGHGCVPGDVGRIRYFGNGVDTRTQGIDLVAHIDIPTGGTLLESGNSEFLFAANWNRTRVRSFNPDFVDEMRIFQLEKLLPRYRFNATLRHTRNQWRAFVRLNWFGPRSVLLGNQISAPFDLKAQFTVDTEISYALAPAAELSLGAENLFNEYPKRNPLAGALGNTYPTLSVFGFSGGFYYARMRYMF